MNNINYFKQMVSMAIILCVVGVIPVFGQTTYSTRIPTAYFATTGTGQSDEGIPPDPYETFSYDSALLEAGIENFNVVYYTSVLPKESYEVPLAAVKPYFRHGAVLETIMAKAGGYGGDTVAAGIGRVWAADSAGTYIGGFAAEYEFVYTKQKVNPQDASNAAIAQLTKSLQHELDIRGLKIMPGTAMRFNTTSLYIQQKYGIALAALCFVNYIFPKPMPVMQKDAKKVIKKHGEK